MGESRVAGRTSLLFCLAGLRPAGNQTLLDPDFGADFRRGTLSLLAQERKYQSVGCRLLSGDSSGVGFLRSADTSFRIHLFARSAFPSGGFSLAWRRAIVGCARAVLRVG